MIGIGSNSIGSNRISTTTEPHRNESQKVVIVGAGTAGLFTALALRRSFPDFQIVVVYSSEVPVIGVGESTTVLLPPFLHRSLGLDYREFFREVRPSWKLGVRFEWGDPAVSHFHYTFDQCMGSQPRALRKPVPYYCLDDWSNASRCWILMDRGLSPCMVQRGELSILDTHGYHIDNRRLIAYLESKAKAAGIEFRDGKIDVIGRSASGNIDHLTLTDGVQVQGDLFFDCSGFQSRLLRQELKIPFQPYSDSLFCDTAIVGSWSHREDARPYTTAETMDHGWCWRIDFADHITRGYVYSSQFCSEEDATLEFRNKNPQLAEDTRSIRFTSGRYEKFWSENVVAIGNSCGFVEPLEATALHMVVEQIRMVIRILSETDGRVEAKIKKVANDRFGILWDEIRDFLTVHYKFNRRLDTPFWKHCRHETNLGNAAEFVELFQQSGPSTLCATTLPGGHVFGYDGFMSLLIGQRVPTSYQTRLTEKDKELWMNHRIAIAQELSGALPMAQALRHMLES